LNTSLDPQFSCCIANVQIEGVDQVPLVKHLWDQHRMIVTPILHDEFQGLRITPNLYTTIEELDRFCDAMEDVVLNGLPQS
jgi:selenocysteine lyase/cysteine desulfurase